MTDSVKIENEHSQEYIIDNKRFLKKLIYLKNSCNTRIVHWDWRNSTLQATSLSLNWPKSKVMNK